MIKITRDVFVNEQKVGTMEVVYDDGMTVTHTSHVTGEVKELHLDIETADTLYDLMTRARPSHDGGQPY